MGVEPYLVAASMRAVLAQRLVRRLCIHCRRPFPIRPAIKQLITEAKGECTITSVFKGEGCDQCRNSGFAGRTGIHELMVCDEEMLQDIGKSMSIQGIRQKAIQRGMFTLLDDTLAKVKLGMVGIDAIQEVLGCSEGDTQEQSSSAQAA